MNLKNLNAESLHHNRCESGKFAYVFDEKLINKDQLR